MNKGSKPPMVFVKEGHLGGYVKSDEHWPNGDPLTFFPKVWDWLIERYRPGSVMDVGCGEGHAVKYFLGKGVKAVGVDGLDQAREAGIVDRDRLILHDYSAGPLKDMGQVDLIWCCEFVEHVEERHSENFLKTFDSARVVCMTHAFPWQAGHHHVNCRPRSYWVERMRGRDFSYEEGASEEARNLDPEGHWGRSGLIFVRRGEREA